MDDLRPELKAEHGTSFLQVIVDELPEMEEICRVFTQVVGFRCPICADLVTSATSSFPGETTREDPNVRTFWPCGCRAIRNGVDT